MTAGIANHARATLDDGGRLAEPFLSVVIPVFNGADTLGHQLDALIDQDCPIDWEVVVVDNGSTDGTAALVEGYRKRCPRLRMVSAPARHNLPYVRNEGVRQARGNLVAFCDDDDLVGPLWVAQMATLLQDHPLVASRLVYDTVNSPHALVGRSRFQTDELSQFLGFPVVAGACGVQRWLWDALGGNDETLSFSGEDFDFSIRAARDHGVQPVLATEALYHYRLRGDTRSLWRQSRRFGRAHVTLYQRYGRGRIDRRVELRRAGHDWWYIVTRAPLAVLGHNAQAWAWRAGLRAGRLEQCLRERVLYP